MHTLNNTIFILNWCILCRRSASPDRRSRVESKDAKRTGHAEDEVAKETQRKDLSAPIDDGTASAPTEQPRTTEEPDRPDEVKVRVVFVKFIKH